VVKLIMPRPRKSFTSLKIEGGYRKDRHQSRRQCVAPSEDLGADLLLQAAKVRGLNEAATKYFVDLCGRASRRSGISDADLGICLVAGELFEVWMSARDGLREHGALTKTAAGNLKANPAVAQLCTLSSQLLKVEMQLGLTPVSRRNVDNSKQHQEAGSDLWEKFAMGVPKLPEIQVAKGD